MPYCRQMLENAKNNVDHWGAYKETEEDLKSYQKKGRVNPGDEDIHGDLKDF